jgi:hypothetical protein
MDLIKSKKVFRLRFPSRKELGFVFPPSAKKIISDVMGTPSPFGRDRAAVSGSLQEFSDPAGRAFSDGVPVCGTQRVAGEFGKIVGALAVEQPGPARGQSAAGVAAADEAMAGRATQRLDRLG